MCVPTRSACQSLQCVMVLLTAKTAVTNSTAQEHVSFLSTSDNTGYTDQF